MWGGLPCIYMRILWKEVFNPIHFIYMCLSKVIMMCGVCGSGKTTYAKKKEQEGYIRLSIDEESGNFMGERELIIRKKNMKNCQSRWKLRFKKNCCP